MARVAIFEQENFDNDALSTKQILESLKILDECVLTVCEGDYLENSLSIPERKKFETFLKNELETNF